MECGAVAGADAVCKCTRQGAGESFPADAQAQHARLHFGRQSNGPACGKSGGAIPGPHRGARDRGIPFPLSLKFHGYIDAKRECEKRLKEEFPNINSIILRPGFVKSSQKKWTYPIYYSVGAVEIAERLLLNKINSNLGEKLQLPSRGIDVETLANYACYGALGLLSSDQIYDNDYMNDKNNLVKLH